MNLSKCTLRQDLALDDVSIPAYDDIQEPDTGIGCTYLNDAELKGAFLIGDNDDDTKPHYWFEHIGLADGRKFYVYGIDLDYLDSNGNVL